MKKLPLFAFWFLSFLAISYAQSSDTIWEDLAQYVEQHRDRTIPQEEEVFKNYRDDLAAQINFKKSDSELLILLREAYWENIFLQENQALFVEHKRNSIKNASTNRSLTVVNENPPLVQDCNLDIVVIVDQSGSINGNEPANIRAGLTAFINNQVGSGNTITLIGMVHVGAVANVSPTITYTPGDPTNHLNWINNLVFTNNQDSWSTGLNAAIPFNPDLVLVITDGATGAGDLAAACAAANQLNTNGANNGNGAHIFVFGQVPNLYNGNNTLLAYVSGSIDPNPVSAVPPPTAQDIATTDFIGFPNNDAFATLADWLTNFVPVVGTISWVNISTETCVVDEVTFSGLYSDCPPAATVTSIVLEVWQNGVFTGISIPVTINADDTWTLSTTKAALLAAGLNFGNGYDLRPRITFSNGTSILGEEYTADQNNDIELCCALNTDLYDIPECVAEGENFTVTLFISGFTSDNEIERIYSDNNAFDYVSHTSILTQDGLLVYVTFTSKTCTCDGRMLVFDVILRDCATPLWVMSDPIPCCLEECQDVVITNWEAQDCVLHNGRLVRPFTLIVSHGSPILDIGAGSNDATCQVDPIELQITDNGDGTSTITGMMAFLDPDCVGHALVSLEIETEDGCCTISRPFSFPDGCDLPDPCQIDPPQPQIRSFFTDPPTLKLSFDLPQGATITVIDHREGTTHSVDITSIDCPPYQSHFGGRLEGIPCNGFILPIPSNVDCTEVNGQQPVVEYHYEIRYGDCIWIITGDYCQILSESPYIDNGGNDHPGISSGENAGFMTFDQTTNHTPFKKTSSSFSVYPNPLSDDGMLNFDLSKMGIATQRISIIDAYGKLLEVINPPLGQSRFQHQLSTDLGQGIYFVMVQLADGTTSSTRLVKMN